MLKSTKNYINKQVGEMHEHFHQIVNEQHRHFHEELDKLKDESKIKLIKQPRNTGKTFAFKEMSKRYGVALKDNDLREWIENKVNETLTEQEKENYERIKNLIEQSVYGKLELSSEYGETFPRVAQFPSWFEIKKGLDKMQAETKKRFEEFAKEHDDCNCIDCQLKEIAKIENMTTNDLMNYSNLLRDKILHVQAQKGGLEVEIKDLKRINSAQENKTKLKQARIEQLEKIQEMDKSKIDELNDSISFRDATIDSLSDQISDKTSENKNLESSLNLIKMERDNLISIVANGQKENTRLVKRIQDIESNQSPDSLQSKVWNLQSQLLKAKDINEELKQKIELFTEQNGKLRLECAEKQDMLDEIRSAIIKVTTEPTQDTESEG